MTVRRATLELIFAGALWGSAFIAQRVAMEFWSPLGMLALRFAAASLLSLPFLIGASRAKLAYNARLAFIPGILLGLVMILQNYGLKHTSVANSGFITTLYVLFVPFVCAWFFKQPLFPSQWKVVGLALVGTAVMCEVHRARFNLGDALTLACALLAAFQIAWIGWVARGVDALLFNSFQIIWVALLSVIAALVFEGGVPWQGAPSSAWWGMAHQVIGATLIAFLIQIRAQRVLTTSAASILFLLEAPFAAFFGFAILSEALSFSQMVGGVIILGACGWAVELERRMRRLASSPPRVRA